MDGPCRIIFHPGNISKDIVRLHFKSFYFTLANLVQVFPYPFELCSFKLYAIEYRLAAFRSKQ